MKIIDEYKGTEEFTEHDLFVPLYWVDGLKAALLREDEEEADIMEDHLRKFLDAWENDSGLAGKIADGLDDQDLDALNRALDELFGGKGRKKRNRDEE
jgi:hypothetical protein